MQAFERINWNPQTLLIGGWCVELFLIDLFDMLVFVLIVGLVVWKHVREKGKKVKYWIWVIYLFLYFMFVILFGTLEKVKSLLINGYYGYFGQLGEKPTTTFSTRSQFSFFSKSKGKKIDVKFWRLFKYGFHPQTTFGISLFILSIFWRFKKQWRKEKWTWISISLVWLL